MNLAQTDMGVAIGPGVGGTFMASEHADDHGMGGTMVTVMGNPWTVNTTTVNYRTHDGYDDCDAS